MISAGLPGDTLFGEIVISANGLSLLGGGWSIRLHRGNDGYADVIATLTANDVIRIKTRVKYEGTWVSWQDLSDDNSISWATKGFGLGNSVGYALSDANTAVYGGFYYWGPPALNVPFLYGAMIVIPRSATSSNKPSLTQIASQETSGVLETHAILAVRKASDNGDGSWGEWEYINPPMALGIEYRTTERYMGKPVYTKLIDCGKFPSPASSKQIAHGISDCYPIRVTGQMSNSNTVPWAEGYSIGADNTIIRLYAAPSVSDQSGTNTVALIHYTKTTD